MADKRAIYSRATRFERPNRPSQRDARKLYFCRVIGATRRPRVSLIECIIYFEISAPIGAPAFRVRGKVHQEQRAALLHRIGCPKCM